MRNQRPRQHEVPPLADFMQKLLLQESSPIGAKGKLSVSIISDNAKKTEGISPRKGDQKTRSSSPQHMAKRWESEEHPAAHKQQQRRSSQTETSSPKQFTDNRLSRWENSSESSKKLRRPSRNGTPSGEKLDLSHKDMEKKRNSQNALPSSLRQLPYSP
jgi:hypothetical protein